MKTIFYLIANLMAGFPDFGFGFLAAVVTAIYLNHPLTWWEPAVAGAVFSVLPDYDIVPSIFKRAFTGESYDFDHHQTYLHWPIVVLPIATAVMWYFFGAYWGNVAFICVFAHYVHDALYMDNGIAWIVRLKRTYKEDSGFSIPDDWIEKNWMQPSIMSFVELVIGTAAFSIGITILTIDGVLGLGVFFLMWVLLALFWFSAHRFNLT